MGRVENRFKHVLQRTNLKVFGSGFGSASQIKGVVTQFTYVQHADGGISTYQSSTRRLVKETPALSLSVHRIKI